MEILRKRDNLLRQQYKSAHFYEYLGFDIWGVILENEAHRKSTEFEFLIAFLGPDDIEIKLCAKTVMLCNRHFLGMLVSF